MRARYNSNKWLQKGFTLIEVLIASVVGLLVVSSLFELLVVNQHTLRNQIHLSILEARIQKIAGLLRYEIHHAEGNVSIKDNQLSVNYLNEEGFVIKHTYLIKDNCLIMIDANGRQTRLIHEVGDMKINRILNGIDALIKVKAGTVEREFHVFTAL